MEFQVGKALPRHDLYKRQALARSFWRRSDKAAWDYAGTGRGTALDATGIYDILAQHERETDARYKRRVSQAIARPYQRQILDRYNDHVFRVQAARPQPTGEYGDLYNDADGTGTKLPDLIKKATRRAQTEGPCYLLADSTLPEVFVTKAQETAAGKRGIITIVTADQVLWWRCWKGVVVEALILMCDENGEDFAFYVTKETTQRVNLKEIEGVSDEYIVLSVDAAVPHSYGGCPLVALQPVFGEDDEPGDSSQGAPLAESVKRICNIESWLHEETQGITFTTTVFTGVRADEVKDLTISAGHAVCLEKADAGIDKISADVAQAESLRNTLDRECVELYRAAGLASGSPTTVAQPESGVAKAFAFNEVEARLSAIAKAAENAENLVVMRLSMGNGWDYPGDAQYPTEFAIPELAEELDYVIRITTSGLPMLLQNKAIQQWAQIAFRLDDAEKKQLDAQLTEREAQAQQDQMTNPAGRKPGT